MTTLDLTAAGKPPSKSQIDYAKHLLKQVGGEEPDWDKLDGVEVSNLIDALKKKRGRPVWYGNGQFSHWEPIKRVWAANARVVARYLEAAGTGRGWEKRRENDEFAKQNIPEEYHLLWEKVKRQFKGDPHSRYEQFMEWVEENPDANVTVQMEEAEKKLRSEQRGQQKKDRMEELCRKRCPSCYPGGSGDLGDAPF